MMGDWSAMGKFLMAAGLFLALIGGFIALAGKIFPLGRLPGDIFYQKGNFSFYFPLASSIIISILLTIILNFFARR